jgi:hypothetical protein
MERAGVSGSLSPRYLFLRRYPHNFLLRIRQFPVLLRAELS